MIPELLAWNIARIFKTRQHVFFALAHLSGSCPQRTTLRTCPQLLNVLAHQPFLSKIFNAVAQQGHAKPKRARRPVRELVESSTLAETVRSRMWRLDGSEAGKWRNRRTGSTHSPLRDPSACDTARDCDSLARSLLQRCPIIRHTQTALPLDIERRALLSGVRFQESWADSTSHFAQI